MSGENIRIYLDNAATTFPKPENVYEGSFRFMRESAGNPGRGAHYFSDASSQLIETTRRRIARFFGVTDPKNVVFTYNCTDSINIALKGWLKTGSHVITTALDHNSVTRPLEHLRKSLPLELSRVPFDAHGRISPGSIKNEIRNNTTLIVLNHGSNVLGVVQDLAAFIELARETGVPILVDSAQTAGLVPIDAGDSPVFLACSVHKGLFGMPGLGILTVPPGCLLEPWREGGSGSVSESPNHPEEMPLRLEAGTPNVLAIASLDAGIHFIEQNGMEKIHAREMDFAHHLYSFLHRDPRFIVYSPAMQENQLALVSFNHTKIPSEELAAILDQSFGIAVRGGLHCAGVVHQQLGTIEGGSVRVSPGFFNTEQEMTILVDALKNIADQY